MIYVEPDPIGLAGGQFSTYAFSRSNPINFTDISGLDTAVCTRRLDYVPFRVGPFFHQFICTGNARTGYTCKGFGPSGNVFQSRDTPGKFEDDSYSPKRCDTVSGDNQCIESCIQKKFLESPPNYSVDLSHGQNCQTFANDVVSSCMASCKAKRSGDSK